MIDHLEPRRHFDVSLDGRVLNIIGTTGNDTVTFAESVAGDSSAFSVTFNGVTTTYAGNQVGLIKARMGAGSDSVILGSLAIASTIGGGKGDDTLSGGDLGDTLDGEGGVDYVYGRNGDDQVSGGLQGDTLLGGTGNDTMFPFSTDAGDDTVSGGTGSDTVDYSLNDDASIYVSVESNPDANLVDDTILPDNEAVLGSPGDDTIINATKSGIYLDGRDGDDSIIGGSGNDTLIGGSGADTLRGFGGNDTLYNGASTFTEGADDGEVDSLFGGSGTDTQVDPDADDIVTEIP